MTSEAFERFRTVLEANGEKFRDTRQSHFMATCPAHPDKNPSLGVDDKGDRIMVRCYAGCHTDDVVAALGLDLKDLFDGEPDKDSALPIRSYVYCRSNGEPYVIKDRYFPKTFIQRLPGTEPGDKSGLRGREPILYRAEKLWPLMQSKPGEITVWLVEGEKDVETAERHGLHATCTAGGAGSRWRDTYTQFLQHAKEVIIVADQDMMKDDGTLGSGQQHAAGARDALRAASIPVKVVAPAAGKDLTDHFLAEYGVDDFVVERTAYIRPRGLKADDLMTQEFKPLVYCVDNLLPAGLAMLAGSPKAGKTWVALALSLAVASGGPALSSLRTQQGSVLHLAREDGYRRLQSRMRLLMASTDAPPSALELIPAEQEWIGGDIGLAAMTEWAEEVGDPRLVVVDTLAKVEPDMGENGGRRGAYASNYSMMAKYKNWADKHDCTVLLIHHDNKTKDEGGDPFTRISGTRGITGAADTLLFLETKRGSHEGTLHVTGRDVREQSLEMYKSGPIWNVASAVE